MNHFKECNYVTDRDHNSLTLLLVRIYPMTAFKLYYVATLSENYPDLFKLLVAYL